MTLDAKNLQKVLQVLKVKRLAQESKYAQTKEVCNLIIDKIQNIDSDIESLNNRSASIRKAFFNGTATQPSRSQSQQDQSNSEKCVKIKDIHEYIEASSKINYSLKTNMKNKALLNNKLFELNETLKLYQAEMLKIDRKREHLLIS